MTAPVPDATEDRPVPRPYPGPFLGLDTNGEPVCAGAERGLLVLGPPRSGKTSAVVVPTVLVAPGAVVSTSTKTDVLDVTGRPRSSRGTIWVFDPSGTTPVPDWAQRLRWSPVPGCERWDTAEATAHCLVSASRPVQGVLDSHYWTERAQALLAPLLHAAGLVGLGIDWVLRWVLRREVLEPLTIIQRRGRYEMAADVLQGIADGEERERSAVFSTAAHVLSAYRSESAVKAALDPNFDPWSFGRSSDTVYICSPGTDQDLHAPLVVTLLDRIRRSTYARESGYPPVVWALDEVANIAPLPELPKVVSEGGGQGLVTVACLQDLSQARHRWGQQADGFMSLFGAKLVLPGIADLRTLELVSALAGEADVTMRSHTRPRSVLLNPAPATVTTYTQRRRRLPVDEVARGHPSCALAINGTSLGWVRLVPYWVQPWAAITGQSAQSQE